MSSPPRLSSNWVRLRAPTMGAVTAGLSNVQASATREGVVPSSAAMSFTVSAMSSPCGVKNPFPAATSLRLDAAPSGPGARSERLYLPVRTPLASGDQQMTPSPIRDGLHPRHLPRGDIGRADVEDLAGAH